MVKGFYDAIPRDIEEAAWIDGAGRMETIRVILFPLASPALAAAALFVFIGVWSDFLTPLVLLQSPDLFPLSIGLFRAYIGYNLVDWGQLAATALLYSVPAVGLYFAVRRQLLSATLAGGVTAQ
jgi:multiple sugar transport system permease protein